MPEQPAGRSYGVVWKVFGEDPKESCYVVEFVGKSHISLLGYVSVSGEVYKVDRPVSEVPLPDGPDMQLVLDESNPSIGEITVRDSDGTMRPQARVNGSPEGTMREQSDHETWNSTRSLRYGEFMASMFLRYVIFADSENVAANTPDADRLDEGMKNAVDKIKLVKLSEPVEVLLGFDSTPLPDAIETLLYRVDHAENPSGIERYAAALMSEIDLPRLRTIAAKSEMSLARIDRSKLFYLNFDRSLLDQDEIDTLLAIECRLNRLSGILERIGAGLGPAASSPSLEGCALFDLWLIAKTTNDVPRLLETLSNDNPWAKPGTVACQPGGEWDVRTRFARIVEALNVVTRLDYTYRANVAEGLCSFGLGVLLWMPCHNVNTMPRMTSGASWTRTCARFGPPSTTRAWHSHWRRLALPQVPALRAATFRLWLPTASRASALLQHIPLGVRPIWPIACLSPRISRAWIWTICRASACLRHMSQTRRMRSSPLRLTLARVTTTVRCRRRCATCCLPIRLMSLRSWRRTMTRMWRASLSCASRQKSTVQVLLKAFPVLSRSWRPSAPSPSFGDRSGSNAVLR